jgi:hypothetical protein
MAFIRKQVYLTHEQDALLKQAAAREQRPEAEIIRAALDERLRPKRAAPPKRHDDSLWDIVGVGAGDRDDVSEDVDRQLYGAPRK